MRSSIVADNMGGGETTIASHNNNNNNNNGGITMTVETSTKSIAVETGITIGVEQQDATKESSLLLKNDDSSSCSNDDDDDDNSCSISSRGSKERPLASKTRDKSLDSNSGRSGRSSESCSNTTGYSESISSDHDDGDGVHGDDHDGCREDDHSCSPPPPARSLPPSFSNHSQQQQNHQQQPQYNPFRVITSEQLQAYEWLVSTPIWIFDFIQRKNRWANPAGLKLWNAPSMTEFINRDMSDMGEASRIRSQKAQNQIELGQFVQEQWTFHPKGQAKTVRMSMMAVRMSHDETHCCVLCVGTSSSTGKMSISSHSGSHHYQRQNSTKKKGLNASISSADASRYSEFHDEDDDEEDDDDDDDGQHDKNHTNAQEEKVQEEEEEEEEDHDDDDSDDIDYDHAMPSSSNHTSISRIDQENLRVTEIIRHLPTPVCQFDMKGRVMYENPAAYLPDDVDVTTNNVVVVHGSESSETNVVGRHSSDEEMFSSNDHAEEGPLLSTISGSGSLLNRFVDRNVAKDVLQKLQQQSKLAGGTINMEAELYTSERRKQWSSIQLRKAIDPVTSQPVILFSSFDKSDAVLAKRERDARIEKAEFLAIMAHEIRTPLHQVTGFIDLLESSSKGAIRPAREEKKEDSELSERRSAAPSSNLTDEQKGYVKLLRSSAEQLMTVISDVLDYSKLEAGHMKIECIPFEPLAVIHGCMAAVRGSCEEKGLSLTLEFGQSRFESPRNNITKGRSIIPFKIVGDPNRLRQVLLNLLSNAIKFTKHGGIHIEVCSFVTEGSDGDANELRRWIQFVVNDSGTGITKANQSTVFQKYQQANASDARKYGGTGLGLAICQALVDKMGGSIGVESEFGKGSSFWFDLPIVTPKVLIDSHLAHRAREFRANQKARSMNILVAEDNKINQKLVRNMLKRMGHESTIVGNGRKAIEMIEAHHGPEKIPNAIPFDVVLMDIQMPDMVSFIELDVSIKRKFICRSLTN
jgi:signal transduction histidine kinase